MNWRYICFASLIWTGCTSGQQQKPTFTPVRPMRIAATIPDIRNSEVKADIISVDGNAAYSIECHSASYASDPYFDYSGEFECKLTELGKAGTYSTLFTENVDQSRDWESRARFFAQNLKGECATIPEFGRSRNFRLRGMKITLDVLRPQYASDGKLSSLELVISVAPDASATSLIAEAVPLPKSYPPQCDLERYFPNQP